MLDAPRASHAAAAAGDACHAAVRAPVLKTVTVNDRKMKATRNEDPVYWAEFSIFDKSLAIARNKHRKENGFGGGGGRQHSFFSPRRADPRYCPASGKKRKFVKSAEKKAEDYDLDGNFYDFQFVELDEQKICLSRFKTLLGHPRKISHVSPQMLQMHMLPGRMLRVTALRLAIFIMTMCSGLSWPATVHAQLQTWTVSSGSGLYTYISGIPAGIYVSSVAFGASAPNGAGGYGMLVAVGINCVLNGAYLSTSASCPLIGASSPDGNTWSYFSSPPVYAYGQIMYSGGWVSVVWAPEISLWAAVSFSGSYYSAMTSSTGTRWNFYTGPAGATSIAWSGTLLLFVAVGTNCRTSTCIQTSTASFLFFVLIFSTFIGQLVPY